MTKWFVMQEYNDDNEPFMMFPDLAAVRRHFYKKRLTKVNNEHYTFKNDSRKTFHVETLQSLNKHGNALRDLQYYGYVDAVEKEKHYWSLVYTWDEPLLFDDRGADRRLMKHAIAHPESLKVVDYGSIVVNNFWGFMIGRFNAVFAPIKPESLAEVPK